jgi:GNAT superfamily N-acetyltransferase
VLDAIGSYPLPENRGYVIDVFHSQPSSPAVKMRYTGAGFEFIRTGPILGMGLSTKINSLPDNIHKATTIQQAETASHSLAAEGERIHSHTLADHHIHTFYATVDGEAVGWLQLVTLYPEVGYINQLYVLQAYRRQRLGTALVQRAHIQAQELGLRYVVLIPSEMAMPLYRRLGYRPLLYFSAFRPTQTE